MAYQTQTKHLLHRQRLRHLAFLFDEPVRQDRLYTRSRAFRPGKARHFSNTPPAAARVLRG